MLLLLPAGNFPLSRFDLPPFKTMSEGGLMTVVLL